MNPEGPLNTMILYPLSKTNQSKGTNGNIGVDFHYDIGGDSYPRS
jgi:hypothetical protein